MDASARAIDAAYAERKANIKTPQYVVDLTEKFRKTLLDDEGDDALKRCNAITHRHRGRRRQPGRAGGGMPRRGEGAPPAGWPGDGHQSRRRPRSPAKSATARQKVLRNATSYEAPRH